VAGDEHPSGRTGEKTGTRGRRDAYILPRHPAELERLDVQHYALRATLGANTIARAEQPALVLDVGSGSGQWAYDLCEQFRDAYVVGLDLERSLPPWPAGYGFVKGNLLQGLPFGDGRFDLAHQRLLISGIPLGSWPAAVMELVRVTRPGGRIELVEGATWIEGAGPSAERLCDLMCQLAQLHGLDSSGFVFRSLHRYLEDAGATQIETRSFAVPIGTWGGDAGTLMATNYRAMFTRLSPAFTARLGVPAEECSDLVARMNDEWNQGRSTYPMIAAAALKPS
jgi:SAM-dependent methyltransferase